MSRIDRLRAMGPAEFLEDVAANGHDLAWCDAEFIRDELRGAAKLIRAASTTLELRSLPWEERERLHEYLRRILYAGICERCLWERSGTCHCENDE